MIDAGLETWIANIEIMVATNAPELKEMTEENNEAFNKENTAEMGRNPEANTESKAAVYRIIGHRRCPSGSVTFWYLGRGRVEKLSRSTDGHHIRRLPAPDKQQKLRPNKLSPFCPIS
ncbi:MAG: hypothetical protein IPG22_05760 [Acidobacteria bacterium]|nr:hypothetical protein [Acidobacteriota bacterium]